MGNRFINSFLKKKKLISISQLKLQQNSLESLESTQRDLDIRCNFLVWAGLRSAIPPSLRTKEDEVRHLDRLGFYYNKKFFDVTLAKSREYYKLLIQLNATLPKSASKLQDKYNIDSISLPKIYLLSRAVCLETCLRDFQFKILNYITCTNILLKKMGKVDSDLCSLCNTLLFWRDFEVFFEY